MKGLFLIQGLELVQGLFLVLGLLEKVPPRGTSSLFNKKVQKQSLPVWFPRDFFFSPNTKMSMEPQTPLSRTKGKLAGRL